MAADASPLPERAAVSWRRTVDERALRRYGRAWTVSTLAHVIPFVVTAAVLVALEPWLAPMSLLALAQAWIIPELYANRGAKVMRPRRAGGSDAPERTALGLLGDLLGHDQRDLYARTGAVVDPGRLGTWVVGEQGALLVTGRRVHTFCVRVSDPDLPGPDRVSHLVLALRADELGFATVANRAFSGARWRVRRRLPPRTRPALDAAAGVHQGQPRR